MEKYPKQLHLSTIDQQRLCYVGVFYVILLIIKTHYMKIKLYSMMILALAIAVNANAQQLKRCATTEYMEEMRRNNPEFNQQMIDAEASMTKLLENSNATVITQPGQRAKVIYTIPVVVHVVYQNATENISDAKVFSQIEILNEDFRRLNADTTNTPSYFQTVAADCEINFCLAQTDPNGNPTNGITRTSTTVTSFNTNNDVKHDATGGKNPWNVTQYFNIWVCDLGNFLLGYGEFPNASVSQTYGLVNHYKYFGNIGAVAPYNLGRTATHEVGHCFNLIHIWGDDGSACTGTDQVADTPNQADENYSCGSPITISCTNGPNGDMYQNYMDYSDDACMNTFTQGQKTRMRTAITNWKASLLTSTVCTTTGINDHKGSVSFTMYPNPASDEVTISYNLASDATLKVLDVTGKVVYEQTVAMGADRLTLSLDQFAAGTYSLNLLGVNINNTQKLVVTK